MTDQAAIRAGLLINAALYLALVVAAGLVWGNRLAVLLAILAGGLAHVAYCRQDDAVARIRAGIETSDNSLFVAWATALGSVSVGAAAGLALLF